MDDTLTKTITHKLVGGARCLDFVNTMGGYGTDQPTDYVPTYAALVTWSHHADLLTDTDAAHLTALAAQRPVDAAVALQAAHRLRTVLHCLFVAVAQGMKKPTVGGEQAREALRLALAVLESGRTHQVVSL